MNGYWISVAIGVFSRTHLVGEHETTVAPGVERLPHSNDFDAAKDKGLILDNGTAQGKAELVAYELRSSTAVQRVSWINIKEITSIQGCVAVIVIDGSMQIVGARLGDGGDDSARKLAVLSAEGTGDHLELLDRFHAGHCARGTGGDHSPSAPNIGSIQKKSVLMNPSARHGNECSIVTTLGSQVLGVGDDALLEERQLNEIPPIEGHRICRASTSPEVTALVVSTRAASPVTTTLSVI